MTVSFDIQKEQIKNISSVDDHFDAYIQEVVKYKEDVIRLKEELKNLKPKMLSSIEAYISDDKVKKHIYYAANDVIGSADLANLLLKKYPGSFNGNSNVQLKEYVGPLVLEATCNECGDVTSVVYENKGSKPEAVCTNCRIYRLEISIKMEEQEKKYFEEKHRERQERQKVLQAMPYKEYLLTPEWKKLRQLKLERAKHRCEVCNSTCMLRVHHKTYENVRQEDLKDLVVLCDVCHGKFHNK